MSRNLPAHPNLEHLRKQAKDLLPELQQQDPDSKLADAQHAIAREYGFVNWPALKAHVESLPRTADQESPFAGTWRADVSKSKRHPLNEFQSATLQFAVSGDTVTITDVVIEANGREEHRNTIQADGEEHPSEYGGYVVTGRWRGARVLDAVVTKDGQVEGRVTYEVSADGRTLTVSTGEQVGVFDRT
jgi:Glyoxalase superfamily protein